MEPRLNSVLSSLDGIWGELRHALKDADNVESIIILELIGESARLRQKVEVLLNAHIADTTAR